VEPSEVERRPEIRRDDINVEAAGGKPFDLDLRRNGRVERVGGPKLPIRQLLLVVERRVKEDDGGGDAGARPEDSGRPPSAPTAKKIEYDRMNAPIR